MKEEYLDSEKYEIRPYRARRPGDIVDDVTLLNRLRTVTPAVYGRAPRQPYGLLGPVRLVPYVDAPVRR